MTNQEAIDILKCDISADKQGIEYCHDEVGIKALEMAIKALEQDPRKITYEDVKGYCKPRCLTIIDNELLYELTHPKINALEQEPSGDLISRDELLKAIDTWDRFGVDDTNSLFRLDNLSLPHYVPYIHYDDVIKCIKGMPSVNPQEPKAEQFAKWVATEIFSDMWEYNKDAFAEIACRKLAKLGIVRAEGDEWVLVKPQEGEEE